MDTNLRPQNWIFLLWKSTRKSGLHQAGRKLLQGFCDHPSFPMQDLRKSYGREWESLLVISHLSTQFAKEMASVLSYSSLGPSISLPLPWSNYPSFLWECLWFIYLDTPSGVLLPLQESAKIPTSRGPLSFPPWSPEEYSSSLLQALL